MRGVVELSGIPGTATGVEPDQRQVQLLVLVHQTFDRDPSVVGKAGFDPLRVMNHMPGGDGQALAYRQEGTAHETLAGSVLDFKRHGRGQNRLVDLFRREGPPEWKTNGSDGEINTRCDRELQLASHRTGLIITDPGGLEQGDSVGKFRRPTPLLSYSERGILSIAGGGRRFELTGEALHYQEGFHIAWC